MAVAGSQAQLVCSAAGVQARSQGSSRVDFERGAARTAAGAEETWLRHTGGGCHT